MWGELFCSFASPWTSYTAQTHYAKVSLLLWHKIHSHVNLELIPEHTSKVIQNHERQLNIFKKKYMYCNFWKNFLKQNHKNACCPEASWQRFPMNQTRLWRRLGFCCVYLGCFFILHSLSHALVSLRLMLRGLSLV